MLKLGELLVTRMCLFISPLIPPPLFRPDCNDADDRMLLIMFLMYTTAHQMIRKQCFEAFWYTHHLVRLPLFHHTIVDPR
jgi:hypothetical protein